MCGGSRKGECSAAGIPSELFEEAFAVIWEDTEMITELMGSEKKESSKLAELQGKLAVISSRLSQMEADYAEAPSTPLAKMMAKLEAEETAAKKELEAETIAERGTVSGHDALGDFLLLYSTDWDTPETRLKMQECYRDMIDRITIDIPDKWFAIQFKGGKDQIKISDLTTDGCKINGVQYLLLRGLEKYGTVENYLKSKSPSDASLPTTP
jgi:hypothetical protein